MDQRLEMDFLRGNAQAAIAFQMVIVMCVGLFPVMQKDVLLLR